MSLHVFAPYSLRVAEISVISLGVGISTFTIFGRLYTKLVLTKSVKIEDYVSVCAWMGYLAVAAVGTAIGVMATSGETYARVALLFEVDAILYTVVMILVKAAILLQYRTIFVVQKRGNASVVIQSVLWVNVVAYSVFTLLTVFRCSPRAKAWEPALPGHCMSGHIIQLVIGTLNVVSDFSILILPMPLVWSLQLDRSRKLKVMGIFGVGLLACAASIVRLYYLGVLLYLPDDSAYDLVFVCRIGVWSLAELAIGVIIGCLPTLPRFFKHIGDGFRNLKSKAPWSEKAHSTGPKVSWRKLVETFSVSSFRSRIDVNSSGGSTRDLKVSDTIV